MTMHRFGRKMHFQPHYQKIHQLVSNISILRIHGCAILTKMTCNGYKICWNWRQHLTISLSTGTIATKVHATDKDLGDNRKIKYSLLDSAKNHFKIDESSGIVKLAKPLDRETKGVYNLTVRAMDSGRPRKSSKTHLLIVVLDVNDNPPEFGSKTYFSTVVESLSVGKEIVQVQATSKDR